MRDSIILPESYQNILIYEGMKSKKIQCVYSGFTSEELTQINKIHEDMYIRFESQRQRFYQTILLYDNIIIPAADPTFNYSYYEDKGFLFRDMDDFLSYNPIKEEDNSYSAEYLKGAIVCEIQKIIRRSISAYFPNINIKQFASELYDITTGIGQMSSENENIFDKYLHLLYENRPYGLKEMSRETYITSFKIEIENLYNDLCWKLDLSADEDAYLVNSGYDLAKLGIIKEPTLKAYNILKVAYEQIIDELPGFNSLEEVLKIKKERKSELKNLREVISNLEDILNSEKDSVDERALESAKTKIKTAKDYLNYNLPNIKSVGEIITLIGVPISTIEFLQSSSKVPIGLTLTYTGASMVLAGKKIEKNKWCEIIR